MHMIMENFRRFTNEEASEKIFLLKEGKVQKQTTLSELIKKRDVGKINNLKLIDALNESIEYEFKQLVETESKDLTKNEIHELFGSDKKRQAKWDKIAAGEDEEAQEGGKEGKKTLKYKFREKVWKFFYSKATAYIKSISGQDKNTTKSLRQRFSAATQALQAGDTKKALKLFSTASLKAIAKPVGMFFKMLAKVLQGALRLMGWIGKILKYPLVRSAFMVFLIIVAFNAVTVGGAVIAAAKVANHTTALITGKTATGHIAGKAAAGAGKMVRKALTKEEMLSESEDLVDIATILGELNLDELNVALIAAAERLEGMEIAMDSESYFVEYEMYGPDGEVIAVDESVFTYADKTQEAQYKAFGALKIAMREIEKSGDVEGIGGVTEATAQALNQAKEAALFHCENDPASCAGARPFADSIGDFWSGHVKVSTFDFIQETENEAFEVVTGTSQQSGIIQVTGGGQAAADIGMEPDAAAMQSAFRGRS